MFDNITTASVTHHLICTHSQPSPQPQIHSIRATLQDLWESSGEEGGTGEREGQARGGGVKGEGVRICID